MAKAWKPDKVRKLFSFLFEGGPRAFYKADLLDYGRELGVNLPASAPKLALLGRLRRRVDEIAAGKAS